MIRPGLIRIALLSAAVALAGCGRSTAINASTISAAAQADASPLAILTYASTPSQSELAQLRSAGVDSGIALRELPMVIVRASPAQLEVLRQIPGLRSAVADQPLRMHLHEGRVISGVEAAREDTEIRARLNELPVSGAGVGIALLDTGVDTTHPDLVLGENIAQTVMPLSAVEPGDGCAYLLLGEEPSTTGFFPPEYVEGLPHTDLGETSGHGTLIAGVLVGSGSASGGLYRGVAPGAKLVVLSVVNQCGTSLAAALIAFDWVLAHQQEYHLRVISISWGVPPVGVFEADAPANIATRIAHDRGIFIAAAAGNSGDIADAMNPISVFPWTFSVGAGRKNGDGAPAAFSSRGVDNGANADTAGQPADPQALPNLRPDLIAPGEELFTTCERTRGCAQGAYVALMPPEHRAFYSPANGTSFSTPFVAAVAALVLEANPALSPDEVISILRDTATPMPYDARNVGAGYVDAHNAVRRALSLAAIPHPADLSAAPPPSTQ